jgi:hypothetical protein
VTRTAAATADPAPYSVTRILRTAAVSLGYAAVFCLVMSVPIALTAEFLRVRWSDAFTVAYWTFATLTYIVRSDPFGP